MSSCVATSMAVTRFDAASRSSGGMTPVAGLWKLPVLWKTANGRGFPRGTWTPAHGAGVHRTDTPLRQRSSNESGQFTCQSRPDRSLVINTRFASVVVSTSFVRFAEQVTGPRLDQFGNQGLVEM